MLLVLPGLFPASFPVMEREALVGPFELYVMGYYSALLGSWHSKSLLNSQFVFHPCIIFHLPTLKFLSSYLLFPP